MNSRAWYFLMAVAATLLCFGTTVSAQEKLTGRIQVECSAGVTIYLDGSMVGTCRHNEVGPQIKGIDVGTHRVRAVKKGYIDAIHQVEVRHNGTTLVSFVFEDPEIETFNYEVRKVLVLKREVGTLLIRAVPALPRTSVTVNGVQIGDLDLLTTNIPAGEVKLTFRRSGVSPVNRDVELPPGKTVELMMDWDAMEMVTSEIFGLLTIPSDEEGEETDDKGKGAAGTASEVPTK